MHCPNGRWCVLILGLVALVMINLITTKRQLFCEENLWTLGGDEFEGFDNVSGIQTSNYIVPNYVHFLRVGPKMKEINFIDAMCVFAAFKIQRPTKLFFHTDHTNFTGQHWEKMVATEGFMNVVEFVPTTAPTKIFGQEFSKKFHLFHAGDVLRIRLLMKYGGIYLDNDCYLVQPLDLYRKYEMALSWDEGMFLGTQVLVAHKDARFLKLWLDSYRDNYYPDLWYYNAGERPTKTVLWVRPELVHRVKLLFGTHPLVKELYLMTWEDWKKQFVIHLLIRHIDHLKNPDSKFVIDGKSYVVPQEYTEMNILKYPVTLREMAKEVYPFQ